MSAEQEALTYLEQINTIITETLEEIQQNRKDARKLHTDEKAALNKIIKLIKQVRRNTDEYLKQFRVQTSLDTWGLKNNKD
tara:strand:- start:603 stop:845 length:243 start_codon:yes stop_codon:yes gene_type:complete